MSTGGPHRGDVLGPVKGPAGQPALDLTSVLLGKMSVSCVLANDWRSFLRITQMSPWLGHDTRYEFLKITQMSPWFGHDTRYECVR